MTEWGQFVRLRENLLKQSSTQTINKKQLYKRADTSTDTDINSSNENGIKQEENQQILEIPLSIAVDAVTFGARNTTTLLGRTLEVPPVKIKVLEPNMNDDELALVEPIHPYRTQIVFEIWKLYLTREKGEQNEAYIVISANYNTHGYRQGEWDTLRYCGFYTTLQEAENEINGYLKP